MADTIGIMKYAFAASLVLGALAHAQEPKALALKSRIDLPNVTGRIDHFSPDMRGQRLFMAALGNNTVEVLDVQNEKRLSTISDLAEPQGVYYDPNTNRLFAACRKDGATKVFDAATFQLLETAKFSGDADNIRYDAPGNRIIVGYGDGALGFLDSNGRKTGEIPLHGHPESFQLEKGGTRVFVNVPSKREIQVADLANNAVMAKWPLNWPLANYPMALDEKNHRLVGGCRLPGRLVVIDTQTG